MDPADATTMALRIFGSDSLRRCNAETTNSKKPNRNIGLCVWCHMEHSPTNENILYKWILNCVQIIPLQLFWQIYSICQLLHHIINKGLHILASLKPFLILGDLQVSIQADTI